MQKSPLLVAVGECLIDLIPAGVSSPDVPLFTANAGGAPANVLAMASRFGGHTAFIGKVGADAVGKQLKTALHSAGIDVSGLVCDARYPTTLAVVHLDADGERSFGFYREKSADVMLSAEELPQELLAAATLMHFGCVSLTAEPSRGATLAAVAMAKQQGAVITYDPNYRPLLWADEATAVREMSAAARYADIIKVSDEEMTLLTDETDVTQGAARLLSGGASLVLVTLGERGAYYAHAGGCGYVPPNAVTAVDTTGAGDAFFGAVLWQLREKTLADIRALSAGEIESMISFANAAGALTVTRKGAIPAMPTYDVVMAMVEGADNHV